MIKIFKANKTTYTPVYIDGIEVQEEENYKIIDINPNLAVIRNPDKLEPDDYYQAASSCPAKYYDAMVKYSIDDDLIYSEIEKLSVYNPNKRGNHMGRNLLIHVLRQLKGNQQIWTSPSADPTPINMNALDGPCYGLKQEELEKY